MSSRSPSFHSSATELSFPSSLRQIPEWYLVCSTGFLKSAEVLGSSKDSIEKQSSALWGKILQVDLVCQKPCSVGLLSSKNKAGTKHSRNHVSTASVLEDGAPSNEVREFGTDSWIGYDRLSVVERLAVVLGRVGHVSEGSLDTKITKFWVSRNDGSKPIRFIPGQLAFFFFSHFQGDPTP